MRGFNLLGFKNIECFYQEVSYISLEELGKSKALVSITFRVTYNDDMWRDSRDVMPSLRAARYL